MKTWQKILIGLVVLGIIGGLIGYKFVYNKPHRDFEKAQPDFTMSAIDLFNDYRNDKLEAQSKYNGKVLAISGMLNKVEEADSLTIAVFVMDEGMFGDEGIRCSMLPNHSNPVKALVGSKTTIKGFVSGYNDTDVIFEKCSILK